MDDDPLYSNSLPHFSKASRQGMKGKRLTSMPNQNRTTAMPMDTYIHTSNNNNKLLPTLSSSPLFKEQNKSKKKKQEKNDDKNAER